MTIQVCYCIYLKKHVRSNAASKTQISKEQGCLDLNLKDTTSPFCKGHCRLLSIDVWRLV